MALSRASLLLKQILEHLNLSTQIIILAKGIYMINNENFDQEVVEKKLVALITFTAEWCKPSKLQKPIIEELSEEYSNQVKVELIDVDKESELADRFNARTLPTSVIYADGELIEVLAGFQPKDFLQAYLEHILETLKKKQATNDQE
jgi:thioredoxin 1